MPHYKLYSNYKYLKISNSFYSIELHFLNYLDVGIFIYFCISYINNKQLE